MKQVLLLADQPFQLQLMSSVAMSLRKKNISASIFLTDLFTFVYGPHLIERVKKEMDIEVLTLEREFRSWQAKGEPESSRLEMAHNLLRRFEGLTSRGRNLSTLRLADPYTNGFEFEDWYLEISKEWADVAHSEIISRCQEVLNDLNPDILVSIDNCQLSTNIFHALVEESRPFITFQNSRIESRWVARFDFAIGDYRDSKKITPQFISRRLLPGELEAFLRQIRNVQSGLYHSPAVEFGSRFNKKDIPARRYFFDVLKEVNNIIIHTPRSIILGPRSRKFKVRRFDQNFFRINVFEAKRRLVNLMPDKIISSKQFEGKGYFFWTLHYRPEGSGLVLGHGKDEITLLSQIAKLLDLQGEILVLKENPLMFGTRHKRDMKIFSELKNVFHAPRFSNPIDWIKNSKGVIGISGTSLLEAAILGIPSYALGVPEFLPTIWSKTDMSIEDFLKNCIEGRITAKEESVGEYLQFILENSSEKDVLLSPVTDSSELANSIDRMTEIIQKSLMGLSR